MNIQMTSPMDPLSQLESQLNRSLKPIQPDQDFVVHLKQRLSHPSTVMLEHRSSMKGFWMVAAGLFVGVFLYWIWRRLKR